MDTDKVIKLYKIAKGNNDSETAVDALNQLIANNKLSEGTAKELRREASCSEVRDLASRFLKKPTVKSENKLSNFIVVLVVILAFAGIYFLLSSVAEKRSAGRKDNTENQQYRHGLEVAMGRAVKKNRTHYGLVKFEDCYKYSKSYGELLYVTGDINTTSYRGGKIASIHILVRFLESKNKLAFTEAKESNDGNPGILAGKWTDGNISEQLYTLTKDSDEIVIRLFKTENGAHNLVATLKFYPVA